jgi:hypothetical protein
LLLRELNISRGALEAGVAPEDVIVKRELNIDGLISKFRQWRIWCRSSNSIDGRLIVFGQSGRAG